MKGLQGMNQGPGCLSAAAINKIAQSLFQWPIFSGQPSVQLPTLEEFSELQERFRSQREMKLTVGNLTNC